MSTLLLRSEGRLLCRSAGSVFWVAVAPIAALIVLGSIPAVSDPSATLGGISFLAAYLPILMMYALCMSTVNLLPPTLAYYRERGILRRLATTPVAPARLLAAQATIYLGIALAVAVIMAVVGMGAYGVGVPHQLPGFVVSMALVAAATTGLGLLVAGLAPSAKAANALSLALFFPLMFFAGLWIPRAEMPSGLRLVSDLTPLGAGVRSVQSSISGHWPPTTGLLVLVVWAVVCGGVAIRTFRWE